MIRSIKGLVDEGVSMSAELQSFLAPGAIFLLTVASGVWLSHSGKPYQTGIFTVHKLIALASVVWMVVQLARIVKWPEIQVLPVILLVLAGLSALALFFSGAMMSVGKLPQEIMLLVHQIAPDVLFISVATAIVLLLKL